MLNKILKSKQFAEYMQSDGVKVYKHFAGVSEDYVPTLADTAMYLYESRGKKYCMEQGINVDASCMVSYNGHAVGRSKLAEGKSNKDLTISLWLEDIGQLGFFVPQLRCEVDGVLGEGWFSVNVEKRITPELLSQNYRKAKQDICQLPKPKQYYTGWKLFKIRLKEFPSKLRSKIHWYIWDLRKAS